MRIRPIVLVIGLSVLGVLGSASCDSAEDTGAVMNGGETMQTLDIQSTAFEAGQSIPRENTCDGANLSPALAWSGAPEKTASFALICDDPDAPAGTWVHWVLFNIPPDAHELPGGVATREVLDDGSRQGLNDFKKVGYGGPCPPRGGPHRYFFKVYALDSMLQIGAKVTKSELEKAMQSHILAQGELIGTYARS